MNMEKHEYVKVDEPLISIGDIVAIDSNYQNHLKIQLYLNTKSENSHIIYVRATRNGIIDKDLESWGIYPGYAYKVEDIYIKPYELEPGGQRKFGDLSDFAVIYPVGPRHDSSDKVQRYIVPVWILKKIEDPRVWDPDTGELVPLT